MSSFPGGNIPSPVPGIPSTPRVTRSNPDRQRREQQQRRSQQPHEEQAPPAREEDSAEFTHVEGPAPHQDAFPQSLPPRGPDDDHPRLDIEA